MQKINGKWKHDTKTIKKMRTKANERWLSQEQRRVQSENQKKAYAEYGWEHFFGNRKWKPYERTEEHRKKMSEIKKKQWAEPGRRGLRSAQQRKLMNERYQTDPLFYIKHFEAAKIARSSQAFKEWLDKEKRSGELRRQQEQEYRAEKAEIKYASEKMKEMQRRKYREACRVLKDYDITPLENQEIAYYDEIIAYFKNMV